MSQHQDATKPLFSVVIPLYNKAPYIQRAIDSVLSQTVQDFEIVVINDGSTDGGENIVAEYDDSRIHLINQENKGVSEARNRGASTARSDILAFLDADDEWKSKHLEVISNLQNQFPDAHIFGTGYQLINTQKTYSMSFAPHKGERFIDSYFEGRVDAGIRNQFLMMSSMAVHKSLFYETGGFNTNLSVGEDLDLYERLSIYSGIAYSPEVTAFYHNNLPENSRCLVHSRPPISWDNIDTLCEEVRMKNNRKFAGCLRYAEMVYSSIGFGNAIRGYRKESMTVWKKVKIYHYPLVRVMSYILNILPSCMRKKIMNLWYGV